MDKNVNNEEHERYDFFPMKTPYTDIGAIANEKQQAKEIKKLKRITKFI